jgi:hypothetical protein
MMITLSRFNPIQVSKGLKRATGATKLAQAEIIH